jgi:hypothetical protein
VTLSSTEAEYVALTIAAKEAVYVRKLLAELHYPLPYRPVEIFEDNQPAINLTDQSNVNGRSKHIQVRWYWIRQQVNLGFVNINWISTTEQAADGLTKALDRVKHQRFVDQLGLVDCTAAIEDYG